ncbi:MAG: haloacid dehalogenase [Thermomicrobiales bacterium]
MANNADSDASTNLVSISQEIISRFDKHSHARDRALNEGRQVVRLSANSIRAVHRGDFDQASDLLTETEERLRDVIRQLASYPSIYWAGYVQDAMKEFAEAKITFAMVHNDQIPDPGDLGVEDAPYLNALAEAASEMRREVLDRLREDDQAEAIRLLDRMNDVYDVLVTIDYPDAITGGLRRTTDALRAVLERSRGDVTITLTQKRLEKALHSAEDRLLSRGQEGSSLSRNDESI